jgi:hypothetical protein
MPIQAQTFTGGQFLEWENAAQRSYIDANVGMASLIAGRVDKNQGKCIDDWFYNKPKQAVEEVLSIMQQYPTYHPRAVILAVVEKQCGKIFVKE